MTPMYKMLALASALSLAALGLPAAAAQQPPSAPLQQQPAQAPPQPAQQPPSLVQVTAGVFDSAVANFPVLSQALQSPQLVNRLLAPGGFQGQTLPIRVVRLADGLDQPQSQQLQQLLRASTFLQVTAGLSQQVIQGSPSLQDALRTQNLQPGDVVLLDLLSPQPTLFVLAPGAALAQPPVTRPAQPFQPGPPGQPTAPQLQPQPVQPQASPGPARQPRPQPGAIASPSPAPAGAALANPTIDAILDNPRRFLGQRVTLTGPVGQRLGPRVFTLLDEDFIFKDNLLVITTGQIALPEQQRGPLRVSGTIQRFDPALLQQLGVAISERQARGFEGEPVLLADRIEQPSR